MALEKAEEEEVKRMIQNPGPCKRVGTDHITVGTRESKNNLIEPESETHKNTHHRGLLSHQMVCSIQKLWWSRDFHDTLYHVSLLRSEK